MLDRYTETKNILSKNILLLEQVLEDSYSQKTIKGIKEKIAGNKFSILVVGQSKRGKSTFINALLGTELLPVAIIPLTSIITLIKYGEMRNIMVFFNDGPQKEIQQNEIAHYVTEKSNPKNEKNVRYVEVKYPSEYLRNGVEIVDTPGIASVHIHNTETTYNYLPYADAMIFLVSVEPPITQAEYNFLDDLRGYVSKIFFVQNKIDMVDENDREESLEFTKRVIQEQLPAENITIYPLSAKQALLGKLKDDNSEIISSGLGTFQDALDNFLLKEKANVLILSIIHKIENLILSETTKANIIKKTLQEPVQELENKIKSFDVLAKEIQQEGRDSTNLLKVEINELIRKVLEPDLEQLKKEKTELLLKNTDEFYNAHRDKSSRQLAKESDIYLYEQIHHIFNEWQIQEEKKIRDRLKVIYERLAGRTNAIINRLLKLSTKILDLEIEPFTVNDNITYESAFTFTIDAEIKASLAMMTETGTYLLPRFLSHSIILKELRDRFIMEVDRHCGRMRFDFAERIEKSTKDFVKRINQTVDATVNGISNALLQSHAMKQGSLEEILEFENKLKKELEIFNQVSQELNAIRNQISIQKVADKDPF